MLALQLLSAGAVAAIPRSCFWPVSLFGIPQMDFQFCFQTTLDNRFGELLDQPIAAQNFTRIAACLEEFVYQFGSDGHVHPLLLLPLPLVVLTSHSGHGHKVLYTLLCGRPERKSLGKMLCVDHNHLTGKVRGLLCSSCNSGLGHFEENIDYLNCAIEYLEQHDKNKEERTYALLLAVKLTEK
jgi:hypothetical protein